MSETTTKISVRATIRFLQVYPIVIVLVGIVDSICYLCHHELPMMINYIFGTSLFTTICLYIVSKRLFVSNWSLILYKTINLSLLFNIFDLIFNIQIDYKILQQIILIIFSIGTISSLLTFLYDKFKFNF